MRRQTLSSRVVEQIAELGRGAKATGDPDIDNERVRAFIAENAASADWERQSPWNPPIERDTAALEALSLLFWHFRETGNPLFAARALQLPLSPEYSNAADWAHREADRWTENLTGMAEPGGWPKDPRRALARAFGFDVGPNSNPFRQVANILRDDRKMASSSAPGRQPASSVRSSGAMLKRCS
jgi:hypothetical protein